MRYINVCGGEIPSFLIEIKQSSYKLKERKNYSVGSDRLIFIPPIQLANRLYSAARTNPAIKYITPANTIAMIIADHVSTAQFIPYCTATTGFIEQMTLDKITEMIPRISPNSPVIFAVDNTPSFFITCILPPYLSC